YDTGFSMLHWVLWDVPATVNELPEGIPSGFNVASPMGAHQATNPSMGSDVHGYWGPCSGGPIASTYEYRLYALSKETLGLMESTSAADAQKAVEGAMLGM